jgi:hypothetical protein
MQRGRPVAIRSVDLCRPCPCWRLSSDVRRWLAGTNTIAPIQRAGSSIDSDVSCVHSAYWFWSKSCCSPWGEKSNSQAMDHPSACAFFRVVPKRHPASFLVSAPFLPLRRCQHCDLVSHSSFPSSSEVGFVLQPYKSPMCGLWKTHIGPIIGCKTDRLDCVEAHRQSKVCCFKFIYTSRQNNERAQSLPTITIILPLHRCIKPLATSILLPDRIKRRTGIEFNIANLINGPIFLLLPDPVPIQGNCILTGRIGGEDPASRVLRDHVAATKPTTSEYF